MEALYPFGYGLTYGDVKVTAVAWTEKPEKDRPLKLRCTVNNTGVRDTDDVVQVYIKNVDSSLAVPNPELAAFTPVFLKAGETKTIARPI